MALPDLTGQNIENTYQRIIQTDGTTFYDGTGSIVDIGGSQNLQQVTEQGSITTIPITASVISASGAITASNLSGNNTGDQDLSPYLLSSETGSFVLDSQTGSFAVTGSDVLFTNITASIISASGAITSSNLSGTNTGDQDLSPYLLSSETGSFVLNTETGSFVQNSQTSSFAITGSDVLFTNVTASTVSASGIVYGDQIRSHNKIVGLYHVGSSTLRLGDPTELTEIDGTNITLDGSVTVSGDISASGDISMIINGGSF